MLRLEGVRLEQGEFVLEVRDMALAPGVTAVIGPSGGGKSTLLSALAGFIRPVAGRVSWQERDITAAGPAARPVQMLFQDHNLFAHLTLAQNAGLALSPGLKLGAQDHVRVAQALARVGLEGLGARRPGQVSGGQQSRAALARILLRDKPVILLDEPFAALGPALRAEMLDLVAQLVADRGATALLVTHDPREAARIAGDAVLVAEGTALPPAPMRALLDDPPAALRAYLG